MQNETNSITLDDVVVGSQSMHEKNRQTGTDEDGNYQPDQTDDSLTTNSLAKKGQIEKAELDESDPAAVCLRFLQELHLGNKMAAENLLSRTALAVIGREQLDLSPIGSPHSKFEIVDVRYASVKQEVAYVECRVLDGEDLDETTTWLLKQPNKKWRISGMIQVSPEGTPRMISFENPTDVAGLQQ